MNSKLCANQSKIMFVDLLNNNASEDLVRGGQTRGECETISSVTKTLYIAVEKEIKILWRMSIAF